MNSYKVQLHSKPLWCHTIYAAPRLGFNHCSKKGAISSQSGAMAIDSVSGEYPLAQNEAGYPRYGGA